MKRITAAIIALALALSLVGAAAAANWGSGQEPPKPAAVNWSR